jgi:hypothetical protein
MGVGFDGDELRYPAMVTAYATTRITHYITCDTYYYIWFSPDKIKRGSFNEEE